MNRKEIKVNSLRNAGQAKKQSAKEEKKKNLRKDLQHQR